MENRTRNLLLIVVAMMAVCFVLPAQMSVSQVDSRADRPKIEYLTQPVQVGSLQTKLSELGNDGWEVVSLIRSVSSIDNADEGSPKLKTEEYQLTVKRLAR